MMASKEEEIKRLIEQMQPENNRMHNHSAQDAIKILRKEGWLFDGSLHNVDLHGLNLNGVDLSFAKLNRANMSHTKLSRANLRDADLDGANLSNTILQYAELNDATLSGSDLSNAIFIDAVCDRAYLGLTKLARTEFINTRFYHTILYGAIFDHTILANLDLSTAFDLKTIRHVNPSSLGVDTLVRSRGKIPEVFLRGCGVPESLITYLPSIMNTAIDFYSCFISYSHGDKSFARRVHDTLQGQGIRCWLDEKEMLPGDDIYKEIDKGIHYYDKFLLCCSKSSLSEKWWVDHEIDKAFNKERELMKERGEKVLALIPLDLDGYLFTGECAEKNPKTQQIRSRIAGNFNGWEHDNALFEREIEKVVKALRTDGGKAPLPTPKL